jgi:hypothetical protein
LQLGGFGIVPKTGRLTAKLFFFYLNCFGIDVKDTSSTPNCAPTNLLAGLV